MTHEIRREKSKYYTEKLSSADTKTVFNTINSLLNKDVSALPSGYDMKTLSNRFSRFFKEKVITIRDNIIASRDTLSRDLSVDDTVPVQQMSTFMTVIAEDITKIISQSPNKSCGLDPLPTWLLKKNSQLFVPIVTSIVKTSLSTGLFPSSLKEGVITPILKKPTLNCNVMKNYRPVSNTAFISKIIEKAALKQVTQHIMNNDLNQRFQSAYKQNNSTETALLRVKSDIMQAIDNRKAVFLVLLDLSAAFDTIDHSILLNRLSNVFGITSSVKSWFRSYLTDRTCRVKVANVLSDPESLDFGLPQGSCVGPNGFSYYTHPLANIIDQFKEIQYHFYADDTQLYITFDPYKIGDSDQALSILSRCIAEIKRWMTHNMLQLNDSKTEFFIAASSHARHLLTNISLQIGGVIIHPSATVRNLGVQFNQNMSMTNHVSIMCRSLNFHLRNISRIRMFLDESACHHAVRALIIAKLDYANSMLLGLNAADIKRLQRIQNRAAKLVFKAKKRDHASPYLQQLHWLPIKARIEYKISSLVYKCFTDSAPLYLSELIHVYVPNRPGLRSANDNRTLSSIRINTLAGEKGFKHAGPKSWNKLPYYIRHAVSLEIFKKHLKTHLFKLYFDL